MKYFIIAMGIMCLPGLILIMDWTKAQHKRYLKKKKRILHNLTDRKVYYIDYLKDYKTEE